MFAETRIQELVQCRTRTCVYVNAALGMVLGTLWLLFWRCLQLSETESRASFCLVLASHVGTPQGSGFLCFPEFIPRSHYKAGLTN